jgi:hypothetical protein
LVFGLVSLFAGLLVLFVVAMVAYLAIRYVIRRMQAAGVSPAPPPPAHPLVQAIVTAEQAIWEKAEGEAKAAVAAMRKEVAAKLGVQLPVAA